MNSLSDIAIFAVVLAVNLFLFGALLAGGLAVVLRFTENASPRFRYLVSIAVFLMAIFVPLAATVFKNSAGQKAVIEIPENELQQKTINSSLAPSNHALIDNADGLSLPPESGKSNENLLTNFVLIFTSSLAGVIFLSVWILGSFLLFLRKWGGIRRLERSKKRWTQASEFDKRSLDCPKNIPLYFADDQMPGTIGWLRPAVVLPREFPNEISFQAKRFIIRHEISHACWRDPLVRFLLRAVRNLFWISPALWLIERLAITECEAAADRAAIDISAENQNSQIAALNYAETLLSIAKLFKSIEPRNRQPQIVGIGAEGDLEIRVRRLLSSYQTTRRQIASAVCACILTALTASVIPVTSFSEIAQKISPQTFFVADIQNNFPVVKSAVHSSVENISDILPQAEIVEGDDKSSRQKTSLKNQADENSAVIEKVSISGSNKKRGGLSSFNSNNGDDNEVPSNKMLGDEDARKAKLRETQQTASQLNTLEDLSAVNGFMDSSSLLQSIESARKPLTNIKNSDELARQKVLSELDSRRDYSPKLPLPTKPPEQYMPQYIPYRTGRIEP